MHRRSLALILVLVACRRGEAPVQPGAAGTFELRGSDAGRLMSSHALATYCDEDSSITVVALARAGSGGVAARTHWAPTGNRLDSLRLGRRLSAIGTATMAFRALGDTVKDALVADSGTLTLRGDSTVSGAGRAWAMMDDSIPVELQARLSDIPVAFRCPRPPQ